MQNPWVNNIIMSFDFFNSMIVRFCVMKVFMLKSSKKDFAISKLNENTMTDKVNNLYLISRKLFNMFCCGINTSMYTQLYDAYPLKSNHSDGSDVKVVQDVSLTRLSLNQCVEFLFVVLKLMYAASTPFFQNDSLV